MHRPFVNKTDWSWLTNSNFINDKKPPPIDSSIKRAVVSRFEFLNSKTDLIL